MLHVTCNVLSVHPINHSITGVLNFVQKLGDIANCLMKVAWGVLLLILLTTSKVLGH